MRRFLDLCFGSGTVRIAEIFHLCILFLFLFFFSIILPSYQRDAISNFLTNSDSSSLISERFSKYGAGYPDVSGQSYNFVIRKSDKWYASAGTSCSCPSVAGMFALINEERLKNNMSPLGFVNPALYKIYNDNKQSYYFNDVTNGYNMGRDEDSGIAFYSLAGWDPITGLGTIKFQRLLEYFLSLGNE